MSLFTEETAHHHEGKSCRRFCARADEGPLYGRTRQDTPVRHIMHPNHVDAALCDANRGGKTNVRVANYGLAEGCRVCEPCARAYGREVSP